MKRIFSLICVLLLVWAAVSCSSNSSKGKSEPVTQQISAETGGEIKSDDGKTSIEIPGDALAEDVEITMTVLDAKNFPEIPGGKVISNKVIEFGPEGTIFKKPVVIKTIVEQKIENKIITAAFYNKNEDKWYYNRRGVVIIDKNQNAGGDPIMETADGLPVGVDRNGHLTVQVEGGDPIMLSNGDPIMLAAGGDPIMNSAAGDPIMNAAAGDPIMMAAGHFSAYTFIALDPEGMQPCSETSGTPCMIWDDAWSNKGLMWSSISAEGMDWSSAIDYCKGLNENEYEHWRLPNINDLRTLITNCEGSQAIKEGEEGGKCKVSAPDNLTSDDRDEDNCKCEEKDDGSYSILGDGSIWLWSSSALKGDKDFAWSINFGEANIKIRDKSDNSFVRCVRSEPYEPETEPDPETDPDQEAEPDSDPETEPDSDNEPE